MDASSSANIAVVSGPSQPAQVANPHRAADSMLTAEEEEIAQALEIPPTMYRKGAALSLQEHYARYLVFLEAKKTLAAKKKDGLWPAGLRTPTDSDCWALFIGRSTWYDGWNKTFSKLRNFPEMIKWLNNDEDAQQDRDLWGKVGTYHFIELVNWIENDGTLVVRGKKKRAVKEEGVKRSHKAKSSSARASTRKSTRK